MMLLRSQNTLMKEWQKAIMPGVIEVRTDAPVGQIIEDICLILECIVTGELEGQILYLPL